MKLMTENTQTSSAEACASRPSRIDAKRLLIGAARRFVAVEKISGEFDEFMQASMGLDVAALAYAEALRADLPKM